MRLSRFLLTPATSVAVLPYAWASPIDPEGLPTIVVDGVTCTLPDAVQAANTGTTVGGCTGWFGMRRHPPVEWPDHSDRTGDVQQQSCLGRHGNEQCQ